MNTALLLQAKASILAQIVAMEIAYHPDYAIDGQSVQHQNAINGLYERLQKLNDLLITEDPYEYRSEMV